MQLTKFSKLKIIHTPGKNLSDADMLSRSFTKAELQLNQLKHKHLPPQIDFALLQDNTLKPVHYLIKHEEILPHQKHDSHPILADYGTDQFSIRINDKGNDIVVKPLQSFSFKSITPFQTKFKTPTKKTTKPFINNLSYLMILTLQVMMKIKFTPEFQNLTQVEALNLTKKDNETVRHFALKVQQLVDKGWCNENASTINLKCNEIFTKGLPKKLKDFANKRQVKHTSTVLEPSILFHTLVKLVDAEDIANDKIGTHDLALEINNITKKLNTQTLDHSSQEQLMYTQPKDPNNKNKPAYKKYCSYCHRTNHSISACFKKQRDDEDKREAYARSKYPQKSFVQYFRSPSNDRTKHCDNRYRSRSTSRDNSYNKNYSQNRYRSTSRDRDRFRYDKSTTPPHYSRSRYDTYKRDSRSYRSPYRSSYRSPYRQNSRPRYRSRSYSRDNKFTKYTNSYRPPSRPRDSRFSRSRSHSNSRNKINMIQQQDQTDPIKFEVHMYHPTAMANAVTPTSWFYTLYVHTPSSIVQRDNPSRLEIAFLLDSGASISVLNYPTYITPTKLLDIRSIHTSDVGPTRNSKTLTVANQTEVPILHYANIILNTTIDENSRYFSVPFEVADIKYNILGTPFFEDNIQNINIQDFTLEF